MILRTTTGRSFKGVGQYLLHDKGAKSADRVEFAETLNMASNRPTVAIAEMIDVAAHQRELKQANGKRGTKTGKPVYHLTLSWDVSEQPTKAEQVDAAREALKSLGLQDHQTLIVAHTDTDNPHVHAVVNLVCPMTGDTAKLGNDRLTLSRWAQAYRKERGQEHLCPQRKANNQRRQDGEFVKADNMSRPQYDAWKRAQTATLWDSYRSDRDDAKAHQKGQYDALWQQKESRFALRRDEIKQLYKPIWRDVFKRHRKELADFDAGLNKRIGFALAQDRGRILGTLQAVFAKDDLRRDFIASQEAERSTIRAQQQARIRDAGREITKAWKYDRDQLKAMHTQENTARLDTAKQGSQDIWKGKTQPDDGPAKQGFGQTADRRKDKLKRASTDAIHDQDQRSIEEMSQTREKPSEQRRKKRERKRDRPRGRSR